jgi:Tol biopolymer transport system component
VFGAAGASAAKPGEQAASSRPSVSGGPTVGAVSLTGASAASHRVAGAVLQEVTSETWSPDGKQIAFTDVPFTEEGCGCGHHVRSRIRRTSSTAGRAIRTVLAAKGEYINSVLWAAGGRMLFSEGLHLLGVGVRGGKPKRLVLPDCQTQDNCQMSAFMLSPNRALAAVWTCDCGDSHGGPGLELVRVTPGRGSIQITQELDDTEDFLGFSANSKQLVFRSASGLMALPVGGGNPVPLAQSGLPGASRVPSDAQQVQWSPDGSWVAYVERNAPDDSTQRLEVVPSAGDGTPRELATCSADDIFPFANLTFSWSHTSKLLAYACTPPTSTGSRFVTVRPDATHVTHLLKGRALEYDVYGPNAGGPQWSPDGSRLVFQAIKPGQPVDHIWTIRANGHDLTRIG